MMLARKEMTIAYEQILGRMDDIKVADGAKLYFSPSMTVPTMPSLPIVFKWRGQTRSPEGDASLHSRH
jgi:hypothetical protein